MATPPRTRALEGVRRLHRRGAAACDVRRRRLQHVTPSSSTTPIHCVLLMLYDAPRGDRRRGRPRGHHARLASAFVHLDLHRGHQLHPQGHGRRGGMTWVQGRRDARERVRPPPRTRAPTSPLTSRRAPGCASLAPAAALALSLQILSSRRRSAKRRRPGGRGALLGYPHGIALRCQGDRSGGGRQPLGGWSALHSAGCPPSMAKSRECPDPLNARALVSPRPAVRCPPRVWARGASLVTRGLHPRGAEGAEGPGRRNRRAELSGFARGVYSPLRHPARVPTVPTK